MPPSLDQLCINTIRFLAVDAVQMASSGHPGMPLGAAPMAYVLWTRRLKFNPRNPGWADRDRFVLSAGHASMLLYGLLYLTGYDLSLDDIKRFRQWASKAPGHPERGHTPGVEVSTGPLGQGFANAVGMAIAEAQMAARYNRVGHVLIDHHTYGMVSDGDLMEGVSAEAASLAGHLKLGKLICLYDDNRVTLSASTDITFSEHSAARFEAYGWHTIAVVDGNDTAAIEAALQDAVHETARPSLILVRTHIGYGSPNKQDTFEAHGAPLGMHEVALTKARLGWPLAPQFWVPDSVLTHMREAVPRGESEEAAWNMRLQRYVQAFPGLTLVRPADANQTAVAWQVAIEARSRPVVLVLSRQSLPTLDRSRYASAVGLRRGGYVRSDASNGQPDLILIGSGSEVSLILAAELGPVRRPAGKLPRAGTTTNRAGTDGRRAWCLSRLATVCWRLRRHAGH